LKGAADVRASGSVGTPHTPGARDDVSPTSARDARRSGEPSGRTSDNAPPSSGSLPHLDKYELIEEIGHGGMATVYRARDPRLSREVAVKVIHKHLRENTEVATRFVAEARAAAKLRHPNIVEVYDVSNEDDAERFLVVELLRGTTLRKILQQNRDMPAEVGASIVLEICEALDHAHESGIIHRDIKPENVLVELPGDRASHSGKPVSSTPRAHSSGGRRRTAELGDPRDSSRTSDRPDADPDASGERAAADESQALTPLPGDSNRPGARRSKTDPGVVIKITDFGIAKILDAQGVTSTGQVLGSPAHMAPEQIEGGEVDARTDVFAVGVLMYECLVGHLPFEGKNPAQVLRKVLDGVYARAEDERKTVGGRWSRLLAEALARSSTERIATPAALGEQIRAELAAVGIDDPKAEVAAYFDDPQAYIEDFHARLVPKLVARAEQARKKRDVRGAADDLNRAAALAPNDLTILKRITSLNSAANRRELLKKVGAIAAATLVVGAVAAGATKYLKDRQRAADEAAAEPTAVAPPPDPPPHVATPQAPPTAVTGPSATATSKAKPSVAGPPVSSVATGSVAPPAAPLTRPVRFVVRPGGAQLTVDNQQLGNAFNRSFQLKPGPHEVVASFDGKCCKSPKTVHVDILPPDPAKPEAVQTVHVSLDYNPIKVSLAGAPDTAMLSCIGFTLFGGQSKTYTPKEAQVTLPCTWTRPDGTTFSKNVTLDAGVDKVVRWPE
jgi:serine/threonine-protein kinase